jgi:sigma-E factor negative regulatory protein RseB
MFLKQNHAFEHAERARGAHFFAASACLAAAALMPLPVSAQTTAPAFTPALQGVAPTGGGAVSVNEWLTRMHEASMQKRSYIGTMVQSSQSGISSARIWHACDGQTQIERIETLTGAPRSSIRHNEKMLTFMPELKLVRMEKREGLGEGMGMGANANFTEFLKPGANNIPDFYTVKALGQERVAGLEAEIVQLMPRDKLRYGYRLWTDRKTALVLKLQTLDTSGAVVEQAAFSELQMDAPVKAGKLKQMMKPQEGWRLEQADVVKTSASAEGWQLKSQVPGFKGINCYKRGLATNAQSDDSVQWVFSDGLATVSLFLESYDAARHTQEGVAASGATNSLFRRLQDHFLTAVGEVPLQTLRDFAQAIERKK